MILIDRMGCAYKSIYHGTEVPDGKPLPIPTVRWSDSVKNRVATKQHDYEADERDAIQAERLIDPCAAAEGKDGGR